MLHHFEIQSALELSRMALLYIGNNNIIANCWSNTLAERCIGEMTINHK